MRARTVLASLVVGALLVGAAFLVVRRSPGPAGLPTIARDFTPGVCTDAADTIVALAGVTRHTDVADVTADDRAALKTMQERVWNMRADASGEVLDSMTEVVMTLGYLRVRLDSRTAEPAYLQQAEAARARLESACSAP